MNTFLASLDGTERAEIEALFRVERYRDGELMFRQGAPSHGGCLIRVGEVQLELALPGGQTLPVERLGPGAFFGEPSLLVDRPRQLAARAVGEVEVLALDRQDFQGLRHSFRPSSLKVMLEIVRMTGRRLRDADRAAAGDVGPCPHRAGEPAEPLGRHEAPGCSFDPLPFLDRLPFFESFSARDLHDLLELGTLWQLPRGRELLRCGQSSDRCFAVIRGAVEAVNPSSASRVALFGPGSLFGQLAPLLNTPVISDCRMREAGTVLELGPEALEVLLSPAQRLSYRFVNAMAVTLLQGLSRANRVLARSENERRLRRVD